MRRHLLTTSLSSMLRRRTDWSRRPPVAMWFGIVLVARVAACATGAQADPVSPAARPPHPHATAKPAIGYRPSRSRRNLRRRRPRRGCSGVAGSALLAALPDEVFGHALTKVLVPSEATGGARWVRDLLAELGRAPSDLTVALAYDPEFPDLRVLAVRVRVVNADRLVGGLSGGGRPSRSRPSRPGARLRRQARAVFRTQPCVPDEHLRRRTGRRALRRDQH